jgi:hypothetical protein
MSFRIPANSQDMRTAPRRARAGLLFPAFTT